MTPFRKVMTAKSFESLIIILTYIHFAKASSQDDLVTLKDVYQALDSCNSAVIGFQELIKNATKHKTSSPPNDVDLTSTTLHFDESEDFATSPTSPFTEDTNAFTDLPNDEESFWNQTSLPETSTLTPEDSESSTNQGTEFSTPLSTNSSEDSDSSINSYTESSNETDTDVSEESDSSINSYTESSTKTDTDVTEDSKSSIISTTKSAPKMTKREISSDLFGRFKREATYLVADEDDSDEELQHKWEAHAVALLRNMSGTVQLIRKDPFEREHVNELELETDELKYSIRLGQDDDFKLVLESDWPNLLNVTLATMKNVNESKEFIQAEMNKLSSAKVGTTILICLVSILLAFVIVALVAVFLKLWRRYCRRKDGSTSSSRSSSTYSKRSRSRSVLEGFSYANAAYVENERVLTIPRPTIITMTDHLHPPTRLNFPPLPRSYISYT